MPAKKHIAPDAATLFYEGREAGFDHFFRTLYPALCLYAFRLTGDGEAAKELASEAFLKTWHKHDRLTTASEIRAYLYRVLRNDCFKWLQRRSRSVAAGRSLALIASQSQESHDQEMIRAELLRRLNEGMQALPAACRDVFRKLYIEGKSVAETAAELRLSPSTVKTQRARGLLSLRRWLSME